VASPGRGGGGGYVVESGAVVVESTKVVVVVNEDVIVADVVDTGRVVVGSCSEPPSSFMRPT